MARAGARLGPFFIVSLVNFFSIFSFSALETKNPAALFGGRGRDFRFCVS
jgi:hypothetical protein